MKWKIQPKTSDNLIDQLLVNRGIKTPKETDLFFNGKISDFENDLKIANIDKSLDRIKKAISNNDLIIVYGDYDVDGICASAILYKSLSFMGAKVLPYIPHREKEGYGLSKSGLQFAKDSGATVVITVDNGIVALEQAKFASELGLDLIITDHHLPLEILPDAFSIVHSTKMCGAAVAWCLVRNVISSDLSEDLLQFVAIATICDVIPLVGFGRVLVKGGLKVLNRSTNPGLLALVSESGLRIGEIGSFEIGYIIGPRLNAIGRLKHAIDALRLLCTKDKSKAKILAKLLCETNAIRQQMTSKAYEDAKVMVAKERSIYILSSKDWSMGIIGLIAGKISEEYYRPAIAISIGEEISKGSARSIDGVNIVEIIRKHSDILIDVGGHPGAAGFSIQTEKIEVFKKRLEKENIIHFEEKVLTIDAEVNISEMDRKFIDRLQTLEPFGYKNLRPVFAIKNISISDIRTVGQGKHLKFKAEGVNCIAFGMGGLETDLVRNKRVRIAFSPDLDDYNGIEKIQLKIKDIRLEND